MKYVSLKLRLVSLGLFSLSATESWLSENAEASTARAAISTISTVKTYEYLFRARRLDAERVKYAVSPVASASEPREQVQRLDVHAPDAAQKMMNRLAEEPCKYRGESMTEPTMRQVGPHPRSQPPYRLLLGYHILAGDHPVGSQVEGEFMILDAQNRALVAVPLTGGFSAGDARVQPSTREAKVEAPKVVRVSLNTKGAPGRPCYFALALPNPVSLEGLCSGRAFLGRYNEPRPEGVIAYVLPGLTHAPNTSGMFYLSKWRPPLMP